MRQHIHYRVDKQINNDERHFQSTTKQPLQVKKDETLLQYKHFKSFVFWSCNNENFKFRSSQSIQQVEQSNHNEQMQQLKFEMRKTEKGKKQVHAYYDSIL